VKPKGLAQDILTLPIALLAVLEVYLKIQTMAAVGINPFIAFVREREMRKHDNANFELHCLIPLPLPSG